MAYTDADLERIRRARLDPYRAKQFGVNGDRRLEMKSDAELRQIEADILRAAAVAVDPATGVRRRSGRIRVVMSKDL